MAKSIGVRKPKFSRLHAPAGVSPVEWQRGLRRQFGREQAFELENIGDLPFFSEFRVTNPVHRSSYRIAIRGRGPGGNFCSCPDYATSELGTCKHVEFALARLEKKRGAKTAFARGYRPVFSELYLRNDGRRSLNSGRISSIFSRPRTIARHRRIPGSRPTPPLARSAPAYRCRRLKRPAVLPRRFRHWPIVCGDDVPARGRPRSAVGQTGRRG